MIKKFEDFIKEYYDYSQETSRKELVRILSTTFVERDWYILNHKIGLTVPECSFEEIAAHLGLGEQRVRDIYKKVIEKLRDGSKMRSKRVYDLLIQTIKADHDDDYDEEDMEDLRIEDIYSNWRD